VARDRPPRDAWIPIKAGQSVVFDIEAVKAQQEQLSRYSREVRGTVLASAFEIEWIIDQLLVQSLLPEVSHPKEVREVFDDSILKRGPLRFAQKVRVLRAFREKIPSLASVLAAEAFSQIERVRNLRNDFAHYPVGLLPDGEEPIRKLKVVLHGAEVDTPLDEASVESIYSLLRNLTAELNESLRKLNEHKAAV
jgi:hypothetical protein